MPSPKGSVQTRGTLIYLMFFGSGVASLTLQVVWFKYLQFVLGSSTGAVSVTIASFFLGLSLGARLGGSFADRTTNPLRAYAGVEAFISILALGITVLLSNWAAWVGPLLGLLAADSALKLPMTIVIGFGTLLLPTMGMGATLPFLARFVVAAREELAAKIGVLYGINTLGAATGALAVGFLLIEWLGVMSSGLFASALYLAISALAFLLSRAPEANVGAEEAEQDAPNTLDARTRGMLVGIFGLSGFVAIAYEVIWFRMLSLVSARSVYAFSSMLAVYLLGLVLGSFICARFLAHKKDVLLSSFARVQILIGASALLSLAMMGKLNTIKAVSVNASLALLPQSLELHLADILSVNLVSLAVFGLPTTLIGIAFPLASELTIHRVGVVGSGLGRLYSWNTLGGVLGSLGAGFLLLPIIGSFWALVFMVALNLGLAALVIWGARLKDAVMKRELVVALLASIAVVATLGPGYINAQLTAFNHAEVLELRESKDATFVVLGYDMDGPEPFVQLLANGTSYANNSMIGRRYMGALAHLPVLLHPQPENAVVICIGTGTTVGALTTYQSLSDIHAVDLSKEVFEFAPHFVPVNESFHTNPKVQKIAADGRHYLLSTRQTFDVLTFEPPPPMDAGVVNLYSEEFYQIAKERMDEESVIAQWVPMTMARGDLSKVLIKAMFANFDHVSLWATNRMEGVAIASNQPLSIDEAALTLRMKEPGVYENLKAIGLEEPEDLLGTFIAADDALRAWVEDVPSVTDDNPTIEYHRSFELRALQPDDLLGIREDVSKYLTAPPSDPAALEAARQAVMLSHRVFVEKDAVKKGALANEALELRTDNAFLQWQAEKSQP